MQKSGSHGFPCRSLLLSTTILNDNLFYHIIIASYYFNHLPVLSVITACDLSLPVLT